ncbi:TRIC cation channel family protein [Streptomyces sp. NPDC033538]|uniref:trimeric intracellular cation channel family protein n=1 Tax=Streptomyces sp. NPDC033538 TaxID=3155367 RepID=UPI0033CD40D6
MRAARLDVVCVVVLGMITALGGGSIRDVPIDSLPPATLLDWRFYTLAADGGLIAFALSRHLRRLEPAITMLDAIGLSTVAVIGASKALDAGLGVAPAMLLGVVTPVEGGRSATRWAAGSRQCCAATCTPSPVNHSAAFTVVQPTLDTGVSAVTVAALAWLGG